MIKIKGSNSNEVDGISRLGRKTLQDLSDMNKIDLSNAIKILKAKGLDDVTPDSRVKHIADELEVTPMEIYKYILK